MYTKISGILILIGIVILLLLVSCSNSNAYKGNTMLWFIAGISIEIIIVLAGAIFSILAIAKEKTILSWICAIFLLMVVIVIIINILQGLGYSGRHREKVRELNCDTWYRFIDEEKPIKKFLMKNGIDTRDQFQRTALIVAAESGNDSLLQWLLSSGANIDAQDIAGGSALYNACLMVHPACVKILLENGANSNLTNKEGNTAAWITIVQWDEEKSMPIIQELCRHRADLSIKNNSSESVMDIIPPEILDKLQLPER